MRRALDIIFLNYHQAYDSLTCPEVENSDALKKRVQYLITRMQNLIATRPLLIQPVRARTVHEGKEFVIAYTQ